VSNAHSRLSNFPSRTRQFWQSRTTRPLSQEDAREMAANIAGFFQVLHAWSSTSTGGTAASMEVRDDR